MIRRARVSVTARTQLQRMLRQGAEKFGADVAGDKWSLVGDCIRNYLTEFPHHGLRDIGSKTYHYPVSNTPFTVVYQYDDVELRVIFIVHSRADRHSLDPAGVEW